MTDILGCILVGSKHGYTISAPLFCEYQACGDTSRLDIICNDRGLLVCVYFFRLTRNIQFGENYHEKNESLIHISRRGSLDVDGRLCFNSE